jgi:hypothetical protein
MRRGAASHAAKPLENQGQETPGEKNSPFNQFSLDENAFFNH